MTYMKLRVAVYRFKAIRTFRIDLFPYVCRPILFSDFEVALSGIRASVSAKDLVTLEQWNVSFGSFR